MSWKSLKICDLDLDLQGQSGLETSKILVLTFKIEPFRILPFNLNYSSKYLRGLQKGDLDLDLQVQIGLETCEC